MESSWRSRRSRRSPRWPASVGRSSSCRRNQPRRRGRRRKPPSTRASSLQAILSLQVEENGFVHVTEFGNSQWDYFPSFPSLPSLPPFTGSWIDGPFGCFYVVSLGDGW